MQIFYFSLHDSQDGGEEEAKRKMKKEKKTEERVKGRKRVKVNISCFYLCRRIKRATKEHSSSALSASVFLIVPCPVEPRVSVLLDMNIINARVSGGKMWLLCKSAGNKQVRTPGCWGHFYSCGMWMWMLKYIFRHFFSLPAWVHRTDGHGDDAERG